VRELGPTPRTPSGLRFTRAHEAVAGPDACHVGRAGLWFDTDRVVKAVEEHNDRTVMFDIDRKLARPLNPNGTDSLETIVDPTFRDINHGVCRAAILRPLEHPYTGAIV
jgi:hypothetical protein